MTMFCGQCGTNNPDTSQFCKNCEKTPGEKPWQSSLQQLRHLVQRTVSFACCRRTGCCSTAGCSRPVIISGLPGRDDPEQLRTCRCSHSTNYGSKTVPGLAGDWGYAVRDRFVAGHPVYFGIIAILLVEYLCIKQRRRIEKSPLSVLSGSVSPLHRCW